MQQKITQPPIAKTNPLKLCAIAIAAATITACGGGADTSSAGTNIANADNTPSNIATPENNIQTPQIAPTETKPTTTPPTTITVADISIPPPVPVEQPVERTPETPVSTQNPADTTTGTTETKPENTTTTNTTEAKPENTTTTNTTETKPENTTTTNTTETKPENTTTTNTTETKPENTTTTNTTETKPENTTTTNTTETKPAEEVKPVAKPKTPLEEALQNPEEMKIAGDLCGQSIQDFIDQINEIRSQERQCPNWKYEKVTMPAVPPYIWDKRLAISAQMQSEYMARTGNYSHLPNGQHLDLMEKAGFPSLHEGGENITAQRWTNAAALDSWMKSPGHCQGVMSGGYKYIGAACVYNPESQYKTYWTLQFANTWSKEIEVQPYPYE